MARYAEIEALKREKEKKEEKKELPSKVALEMHSPKEIASNLGSALKIATLPPEYRKKPEEADRDIKLAQKTKKLDLANLPRNLTEMIA
ncbi:MAG: hypothetical protein QXT45_01820 [Candidatus Bilamarchaeaceae archaeon]